MASANCFSFPHSLRINLQTTPVCWCGMMLKGIQELVESFGGQIGHATDASACLADFRMLAVSRS